MNNWDLVDTSAREIIGEHLKKRSRRLLDQLAKSENVWERRIAIVSTLAFMKEQEIRDALRISRKLLADKHDLILKAVGWVLRESGKVSRPELLAFLQQHYTQISRTTLRYAIEHFPREQRAQILDGDLDLSDNHS